MIIENGEETYMKHFEEFKEDYSDNKLTVKDIMEKYQWGKNDYKKAVHHAWDDGIQPRKAGRRRIV